IVPACGHRLERFVMRRNYQETVFITYYDLRELNFIAKTFSDLHRLLHKPRYIDVYRQPSTYMLNNFTGNNISNGKCLAHRESALSGHEECREEGISCSGAISRLNRLCRPQNLFTTESSKGTICVQGDDRINISLSELGLTASKGTPGSRPTSTAACS